MSVNRRQFIKAGGLALGSLAVHSLPLQARPSETKATVYFTSEITTESLLRIYEKVCAPLQGRIAIKLHTGEPHGPNILPRDMVRALQARIPKSAIVECNVLYPSPRQTTEGHRETLRTNGWTFCPVDIMDADGDVSLPIPGGRHLKEVAVGKNLLNYDSMLVLTHFKGHTMGGFGGSLKNIAIGCASGKTGKAQLHSDGTNLWARPAVHGAHGGRRQGHYHPLQRTYGVHQCPAPHVRGLRLRGDRRRRTHRPGYRHPGLHRSAGRGPGVRGHGLCPARKAAP